MNTSIILVDDCHKYIEDPAICDDVGSPKGQCVCGAKWYEHPLPSFLDQDSEDCESAAVIQKQRGVQYKFDI